MNHNDYKEMIPARALSALDAAEDRVLTDHLASCEECRRELDDWQSTTAGLAFEAVPLEPSPRVKQQILTQVRELKIEVNASKVVPFVQPKRNVWSSFGSVGAIAAALLFVGLLVYAGLLWQENRAIHKQLDLLVTENNKLKQDADLQTAALKIISAPGAKMMDLNATPMAPGATAKIAFDKAGHAMLMARGLPKAPEGKQYQLWFIVGTEKMPGKTFAPDVSGSGVLMDQVPSSAMQSGVFAITLEPSGGVKVPTGQIYLVSPA
jgi:anti-sigma-K factor RskA